MFINKQTNLGSSNYIFNKLYAQKLDDGNVSVNIKNLKEFSIWQPSTEYKVGDVVTYNNKQYECINAHKSGSTFSSSDFQPYNSVVVDDWVSATSYAIGNLVVYDNTTGINTWTSGNQYNVGDKVVYNGVIYECTTANTDTTFTATNWNKIADASRLLYRCITANNDTNFTSAHWELLTNSGSSGGGSSSGSLVSLYTGTSQITSTSGSVQYGLSDNPRNYDFVCFVFESIGTYDNITETTFTTGSTQMLSFGSDSQGLGRNSSDAYGGWVKMTNTNITVGLRTKGSDVVSVCLKEVLAWNVGSGSGSGNYLSTTTLHTETAFSTSSKSIALSTLSTYDYLIITYSLSANGTDILYSNTAWVDVNELGEHLLTVYANNQEFAVMSAQLSTTGLDINSYQIAGLGYYRIDSVIGVKQTSGGGSGAGIQRWTSGSTYAVDDVVIYDNSTGINAWVASNSYSVADKVTYNNDIYECITANTDATFDPQKWALESPVFTSICLCLTANSDTNFDDTKWEQLGGSAVNNNSLSNLFA